MQVAQTTRSVNLSWPRKGKAIAALPGSDYVPRPSLLREVAALWIGGLRAQPAVELLLVGGLVHDGSGQQPVRQDIGVAGERIGFVGNASAAGLDAAVVVDVDGLLVTPGFIDMHSYAELTEDYGRDASPLLDQGITTVAIGVDDGGTPDVAELFAGLEGRIGVNTFAYAGHGEIRERVIGADDHAPTLPRGQLPGRRLSQVDTRGDRDR